MAVVVVSIVSWIHTKKKRAAPGDAYQAPATGDGSGSAANGCSAGVASIKNGVCLH